MDFKHTIRVERPADEVFAFVSDASNNPRWQKGMKSCTWTSDGPIAVGSTYDQAARFLGRDIISTFVVTDLQPGRSISIETTKSTFPIQVTRSVEPDAEACLVTAHIRGQPGGLLKLFSGLVPASVRKDYARLQELLEG
jgi:carbon monoxide dehydrogenase subunit G